MVLFICVQDICQKRSRTPNPANDLSVPPHEQLEPEIDGTKRCQAQYDHASQVGSRIGKIKGPFCPGRLKGEAVQDSK